MSVRAELRRVDKWQEVQGAAASAAGCEGGGVFSTSEAEALAGPEHRGEAAGGPAPKWRFIFSASTLSRLHPGSGSRLWGLPLIPLDPPLSPLVPPWAAVCARFLPHRRPLHHSLLFAQSGFFLFFAVYQSCFWLLLVRTVKINQRFSLCLSFCFSSISQNNCSVSYTDVINVNNHFPDSCSPLGSFMEMCIRSRPPASWENALEALVLLHELWKCDLALS